MGSEICKIKCSKTWFWLEREGNGYEGREEGTAWLVVVRSTIKKLLQTKSCKWLGKVPLFCLSDLLGVGIVGGSKGSWTAEVGGVVGIWGWEVE